MTVTIKKKSSGSYFLAECPELTINKSEESGNWITCGLGYEDISKTKREAVDYAIWVYNFANRKG